MGTLSNKYPNSQAVEAALNKTEDIAKACTVVTKAQYEQIADRETNGVTYFVQDWDIPVDAYTKAKTDELLAEKLNVDDMADVYGIETDTMSSIDERLSETSHFVLNSNNNAGAYVMRDASIQIFSKSAYDAHRFLGLFTSTNGSFWFGFIDYKINEHFFYYKILNSEIDIFQKNNGGTILMKKSDGSTDITEMVFTLWGIA